MFAAKNEHKEVGQTLVDIGAEVDAKDNSGRTGA